MHGQAENFICGEGGEARKDEMKRALFFIHPGRSNTHTHKHKHINAVGLHSVSLFKGFLQ